MRVVRKGPEKRRGHLHGGLDEVREGVCGYGKRTGGDSGKRDQRMQKLRDQRVAGELEEEQGGHSAGVKGVRGRGGERRWGSERAGFPSNHRGQGRKEAWS